MMAELSVSSSFSKIPSLVSSLSLSYLPYFPFRHCGDFF
ncbi:hypothetical protein U0070_002324 [Myodes glareolus]|uniref:Uncharacterized protein n=1 Tax=Myodes glareolus TaxID=447135 RepID=A0AAW0I2M2_MYOGA